MLRIGRLITRGLFAVLARRNTNDFFEDAREIIRVFVADFVANIVDGARGEREQRAGMLNLEMNKIVHRGIAGLLTKDEGKMRDRQSGMLGHVFERE